MSEANKRETLLPEIESGQINLNNELLTRMLEIIESLTNLNQLTIDVLSQYINVDNYERMMAKILEGNDVIIE